MDRSLRQWMPQGIRPGQALEERGTLLLQPACNPMAHVHIKVVAPLVAGTVQHLVKLFMARVEVMRLGCETSGVTFRQLDAEESLRLPHHALGDHLRP